MKCKAIVLVSNESCSALVVLRFQKVFEFLKIFRFFSLSLLQCSRDFCLFFSLLLPCVRRHGSKNVVNLIHSSKKIWSLAKNDRLFVLPMLSFSCHHHSISLYFLLILFVTHSLTIIHVVLWLMLLLLLLLLLPNDISA